MIRRGSHRYGRSRGLPAVLVVACLVLTACGGGTFTTPVRSSSDGDGVMTRIAQAERRALSPIGGVLLDGGQYDSRKNLGKVVVYNVWGSWCAPCRKEAPVLRQVSSETAGRGVTFVGINVKDNDSSARAFERTFEITYPSITTASSSRALLAFGPGLPSRAVPSTIVVDRQGRVAARILGATTYGTLTSVVDNALAEKQ